MSEIVCSFPQFGMYRPLSASSQDEMRWFGEAACAKVADYFEELGIDCEPEVQSDFGATFSSRMMLVERAAHLQADGFDYPAFCDCIGRSVRPYEHDGLEVQLAGARVGRYGVGISFTPQHAGTVELLAQRNALQAAARQTHGQALAIRNPNHVTVLGWRRGTGCELDAYERAGLRVLMEGELTRHGIGSISLCRLVVGMGYLRPWTRPLLPLRLHDLRLAA